MKTLRFKIKLTKSQNKAYELLHKEDVRYLVCCWSRQQGKSVFAEISLIEYLCKPKSFSYYISPTFSQGRKVFKDILRLLESTNIITKYNSSTLTIETIFGSTLQFFSFENITAVRGNTVNGLVVIDEAAFAYSPNEDDPFNSVIYPTIKANFKKNKVLVISTPKGKRGLFWNLWCKALNGDKGYAYLKATIYDDNLVDADQLDEIKNSMPLRVFQEEFLCEFLDSSSTYFEGFEKCFGEFVYDDDVKQYIGIDLSANGKDETILTKINEINQVKQYLIKGTLDQKYRQIADIIDSTNNLQIVLMENNGVGAPIINEVKKLVKNNNIIVEWITTNSSKNEILSDLALEIANQKLYFDSNDGQLYSQFGTIIVKFTKTGKLQIEASSGFKDDRIMSLGIALRGKNDKSKAGYYNFSFLNR